MSKSDDGEEEREGVRQRKQDAARKPPRFDVSVLRLCSPSASFHSAYPASKIRDAHRPVSFTHCEKAHHALIRPTQQYIAACAAQLTIPLAPLGSDTVVHHGGYRWQEEDPNPRWLFQVS